MIKLIKNPYVLGYSALYIVVLLLMRYVGDIMISDVIAVLVIIGFLFSFLAHLTTRSAVKITEAKVKQKNEITLIILLVLYITTVLSFGIDQLQSIISHWFAENKASKELITISYKLVFFVLIPFLIYRYYNGFNLRDFGLQIKLKEIFTKKNAIVLLIMGLVILLFQYFLGNGAAPIREGIITQEQLLIGLPLFFIWLLIEVGLVEEFFFRSLLQSRIAVITRSEIGGIVVSGLLFGLAHAPGFYLRKGGVLDSLGTDPSLFMSIGYSILVLSVAGFFLGILWSRTRNLWLVMVVHAMVDLLPGLNEFVETWSIT